MDRTRICTTVWNSRPTPGQSHVRHILYGLLKCCFPAHWCGAPRSVPAAQNLRPTASAALQAFWHSAAPFQGVTLVRRAARPNQHSPRHAWPWHARLRRGPEEHVARTAAAGGSRQAMQVPGTPARTRPAPRRSTPPGRRRRRRPPHRAARGRAGRERRHTRPLRRRPRPPRARGMRRA